MKFYDLLSLVSANKQPLPLHESTDSFSIAGPRPGPYIQPTLTKCEFEHEKPTVILISAVGATGKTTLAQVLSHESNLPMLNLAKHKPVGDYTLTGLLTSAFTPHQFGKVIEGLSCGSYGVIIDGVDEGRSKTSDGAFYAFLDDIARLSKSATTPTFILLGRTQILDTCWLYLVEKGIKTGLLTIAPFDVDQARSYVDEFTNGLASPHLTQYVTVRDLILHKLSGAFGIDQSDSSETFLSFIGYPPVLDAIVTLLDKEQNYHKLGDQLSGAEIKDVEIDLLVRIACYVLDREKNLKVVPNILDLLTTGMPENDKSQITARTFDQREQCLRLVSYCLNRHAILGVIGIPHLDEKYEARLESFLPEHPFLAGRKFQNAVFEAYSVATLILSDRREDVDLALEYVDFNKHNYHFVYMLDHLSSGRQIPIRATRAILGSALEFRTRTASVQIEIETADPVASDDNFAEHVQIEIEVSMGNEKGQTRSFAFRSHLVGVDSVNLGARLASTFVILPCEIVLSGPEELELTAPTIISANRIVLQSQALTLKSRSGADDEGRLVLLDCETLASSIERINTNGVELALGITDSSGLVYPLVNYIVEKPQFSHDPLLKEKYMRLRRILVEFRSHSRGTLARYKHKIENKRLIGDDVGPKVLDQLLKDGILRLSGNHYFLEPGNVHKYLGVSWSDLRKGAESEKLQNYLRGIA